MKHLRSPLSAVALWAAAGTAAAHEGHGLGTAAHWHATDAWGYVALAAIVAVAAWCGRRD